jgi:hypothetical protein
MAGQPSGPINMRLQHEQHSVNVNRRPYEATHIRPNAWLRLHNRIPRLIDAGLIFSTIDDTHFQIVLYSLQKRTNLSVHVTSTTSQMNKSNACLCTANKLISFHKEAAKAPLGAQHGTVRST